MIESPCWNLPLLTQGQAQKEISHNEALLAVDRVLHLAVVTRALGQPPQIAASGDSFIVGSASGGDWDGCEGMLASHDGSGWVMTTPRSGCLAWVRDEAVLAVFDDSRWRTLISLA